MGSVTLVRFCEALALACSVVVAGSAGDSDIRHRRRQAVVAVDGDVATAADESVSSSPEKHERAEDGETRESAPAPISGLRDIDVGKRPAVCFLVVASRILSGMRIQ